MLKDIQVDNNINVGVAIVRDLNYDVEAEWTVFVVNLSNEPITNVMVTCKGYGNIDGEHKETTTMRYFLNDMEAQMAIKVEPINPDLFVLDNEYFLTFFQGGEMHDKKIIFKANTITDKNFEIVEVVLQPGIYLQ